MNKPELEIVSLNLDDLDIEELERRLEMASGITALGYLCGADCGSNCVGNCGGLCAANCPGNCTVNVGGCTADCGTNVGGCTSNVDNCGGRPAGSAIP